MLSDEEKQIFNNLKDYMQNNIDNGYHKFIYNDLGWDFKCIDCINAIENVLNLIEKNSKEIEELHKEINQRIKLKLENEKCADEDFIYKDKIKAKIEELKIERSKLNFESDCMLIDDIDNKIEVLESLLKKE